MSSEQQDTNPYASPETPSQPSFEGEPSAKPKRLRWRMIPAGLLLALGGMQVLTSIGMAIMIAVLLIWKGQIGRLKEPAGVQMFMMAGGLGLAGSIWVYSALAWWRRRWWRAVLTTILGYAIGCGAGYWMSVHNI